MGLFSNYDVEDIISEGESATVYKCVQSSTARTVAIKVLSQQLLNQHPEIAKNFEKISDIVAKLNHPNIVHITEHGRVGGLPYFVMNYVDGISLDVALQQKTLKFSEKLDIVLQISKALTYAHKNGIIHLNLKPANVLIDKKHRIQITDFGVAHLTDGLSGETDTDSEMSKYWSPEQKSGRGIVTTATDCYSLGVMMYELFTGRLPGDPLALPSYHDSSIPPYLDEVVTACLEPDPKKRYPRAEKIKEKLLESMWGAHLPDSVKQRTLQGMGDINTRFVLLDVVQENRYGGVYLCENSVNHSSLIVKKIVGTREGYKECTILSNLQHPNVTNIYGTATDEGVFIVLMEYLAGGSLADRLVSPWEWKNAVKIVKQICQGLSFIHGNNMVHGNLRPSNILFSRRGEAKVADCALNEHYQAEKSGNNHYVYPNEQKSKLTDIYSVGAMLFEMVAGMVPVWKHNELVVNAKFRSLPESQQAVLKRMLSIVPKDRYRDFNEVIKALDGLGSVAKSRPANEKVLRKTGTSKILLLLLVVAAAAAIALTFGEFSGGIIDSARDAFGL